MGEMDSSRQAGQPVRAPHRVAGYAVHLPDRLRARVESCQLAWDIPGGLSGTAEGIQNPDGEFHGPVRLREALASDYLVPAAEILTQLGAESVARIAAPFGIAIPANRADPLLGDALLNPLEVGARLWRLRQPGRARRLEVGRDCAARHGVEGGYRGPLAAPGFQPRRLTSRRWPARSSPT